MARCCQTAETRSQGREVPQVRVREPAATQEQTVWVREAGKAVVDLGPLGVRDTERPGTTAPVVEAGKRMARQTRWILVAVAEAEEDQVLVVAVVVGRL